MPDDKNSWRANWSRWKPRLKWPTVGLVLIGLAAAALWWSDLGPTAAPGLYEVYARPTDAREDPDATAADIKAYLTENFHPDDYEYVGIVAQRLPSSQSPSTTTYVLFKRK